MITLQDYLTYSKDQVKDILCHSGVHFVIGNESCDLDSMVSSIALAYLYHLTKYKNGYIKVIPVMNINSSEFKSRTLNKFELEKYNLRLHSLVFKDKINFKQVVENKGVKVTLVDHHVLCKDLNVLKSCVVGIFDHRPVDEEEVWPESVNVNIEPVGSCATLIGQQYFALLEDCTCVDQRPIFELIRDTIIYDTIALNPQAKKVTEADIEICDNIEKIIGEVNFVKDIFKQLSRAHNDISNLTTSQILVKDLKAVGDVYIPGLPMLVYKFLKRNDVKSELQEFCKRKKATLVVLMGIETIEDVQRDLALYSPDKHNQLLAIVKNNLLKSELELEEEHCHISHVIYFKQNNVSCSRKQVIPIIKESI